MLVTVFSCVERLLGFIYRIFLSHKLGAEGLGIYQISLSILGLFMTITSSGIPITVSRMMIKYKQENKISNAYATVSAGILTTIAISVPLTLLVFSKSGILNILFSDSRCLPLLAIMIPGLIFTSVYAVIRGTFWGNKQFFTYSIIEFCEEAVMLIAGIILVNLAVDFNQGVHMAGYAVLISYLFSFTVSILVFFIKGGKLKAPINELSPLVKSSTPITAMRTSTSLVNTLIAIILPARLIRFGISSENAMSLFGTVFGMAFPLIFMPSTLIGSIALVLTPEISADFYAKNYKTLKNNVEKALKISCIIACTIIPILLTYGSQIGEIIYSNSTVGNYVKKGAITMLPLSLSIISTSALNSLNKEKQTLLSFFVGASAMILCIYFLPKFIGIDCLILGIFLNYTLSSTINVFLLQKHLPIKIKIAKHIFLSILAIIPSAMLGIFLKNTLVCVLGSFLATVICSIVVFIFTVLFMVITGLYDCILDNYTTQSKLKFKAFKKRNSLYNRH